MAENDRARLLATDASAGLSYGFASGIRAVWADDPGPTRMVLQFRVGRGDEVLARGGLTHLVEHLALHRVRNANVEFNGVVDATSTTFGWSGEHGDAVAFLEQLCASLAGLPIERLADEARILQTEASGRGGSPVADALAVRYGARGLGLLGCHEFGLRDPAPDDVLAHASRYFTVANAGLASSRALPLHLDLALPDGEWIAPIQGAPVLESVPAWSSLRRARSVTWSFVSDRSVAHLAALDVLASRARERLRHEQALSYAVGPWYAATSADVAHSAVIADAAAGHEQGVVNGFAALLDELVKSGPTTNEFESALRRIRPPDVVDADARFSMALGHVRDALLGRQPTTLAELNVECNELEPVLVHRQLAALTESSVVVVPASTELSHPSLTPARPSGPAPVASGARYFPILPGKPASDRESVLLSERGISYFHAENPPVTIEWADVVAALRSLDGTTELIAGSGSTMFLRREAWWNFDELCADIDARIPGGVLVDMGGREVPTAPPSPWHLRTSLLMTSVVLAALFVITGIAMALNPEVPDDRSSGVGTAIVGSFLLGFALRTLCRRLRVRPRQRRKN